KCIGQAQRGKHPKQLAAIPMPDLGHGKEARDQRGRADQRRGHAERHQVEALVQLVRLHHAPRHQHDHARHRHQRTQCKYHFPGHARRCLGVRPQPQHQGDIHRHEHEHVRVVTFQAEASHVCPRSALSSLLDRETRGTPAGCQASLTFIPDPGRKRRLSGRRQAWRMRANHFAWVFVSALLAGCATYRPLPLDNAPRQQKPADITVPAASMPVPELRAHRFDPADGLDVTEVAMLAVANNPDLRSQRDGEGIARAQAFAAGLLPDPQVSYERDRPDPHQAENTTAFNLGLTWNLGDLLTRSARVASAKADARQVHLDLLWNEWQTIAQARTLFDKLYSTRALVARLQQEHDALAPIQQYIERALKAGDLTYDSASAGLNAASDVDNKLADARRQLDQTEHDLHALLGLDDSVSLHLVGAPYTVEPDAAHVAQAVQAMP